MVSVINKWWVYFSQMRWLFWLLIFGIVFLMGEQLSTQLIYTHWLVNMAAIQANKGLYAPCGPDETQLEMARQKFYQAIDNGYKPYTLLQRLREIESSRWFLQSQILKQQGKNWEQVFTYQEWTRRQFDRTILDLWKSSNPPNWFGLGNAAERMQLWSLAAYFYKREIETETSKNAQASFGLGQALLRLGKTTEAEKYLMYLSHEDSPKKAQSQWLLAQSFVAQERWNEAARLIEIVAQHAPMLLHTAEAASIARQIEAHNALVISPDLQAIWVREKNNLLMNGGFENGYMDWGMWPEPGANSTIDDQRVYSGLQSFRVQFDGTQDVNYYQVSQYVTVQPGKTYKLSAHMWAEDFTGYLGVEVRGREWFGGNTTQVHGSTSEWQVVTLVFTVPMNVTSIEITLRRYDGHGLVSGIIWIDDIILEPL